MEIEVIKANKTWTDKTKSSSIERMRVAAYCRVSTDSEDQLNSYKSQVRYYTDLIEEKKEWVLAGIYADEAITGTQVTKREDFRRMINDCMYGKIDMVITKSISRFARNTLDTLKYVRMLKEKNIAIFFEDEKINTMTMDGELLLVVLSSVAQQEVENISDNVKKGLKMKMQRGELVGFHGCMGYDYDPVDKSLSVNEAEAEIVRLIFQLYTEGKGATLIKNELDNLGYKTKGGYTWTESTIIGIIKNEKYKGDILLGKTFTVDPISKRRLDNNGEEDQFYIKNHHEPIVSEEVFNKAQAILKRRTEGKYVSPVTGKREKFSRQYAFSCLLECGFCGANLTRRSRHGGTEYKKVIWQCVTATKKGRRFCSHSKAINEKVIEEAFVESYKLLCGKNKDVLDDFIQKVEESLGASNIEKQIIKIDKDISSIENKKKKLLDMRLNDRLDDLEYSDKVEELNSEIQKLLGERAELNFQADNENELKKRIIEFKRVLEQNQILKNFDRDVFESVIDKVIVGEIDDEGNKDPYKITFVYKTGISNKVDGRREREYNKVKGTKTTLKKMGSKIGDKVKTLATDMSTDTHRDCCSSFQGRYRLNKSLSRIPIR